MMAVQLQQRHRVEEEELAAESEVEIDDDLVGGMTSGANAAAATLTSEQQPLEGVERQATSADDAEEEEEEEISTTIDEATSTVQLPRVRQLGSVRQTLLKQAELSRISPAVLSVLSSKLRISTVDELLHASRADIQRATKLSLMQVNDILSEASSYVFPSKPRTALQLLRDPLERQRCLPLGCAVLDEFLAGGVRVGALTEITGAAGTGKSQLCMQLALSAQLPEQLGGLDGGASLASAKARSLTRDFALTERAGAGAGGATEVVYISTEKPFPSSRWKQLLRAFHAKHAQHFGSEAEIDRRVHRHSASTIEVLWEFLTNHLPLLLNSRKVRLLLIDSIAAVCRFEFERSDAAARAKALWLHAHYLRSVADNYKLPVVVVNQVSDYFGTAAESDLHHHLLATTTTTTTTTSWLFDRHSSTRARLVELHQCSHPADQHYDHDRSTRGRFGSISTTATLTCTHRTRRRTIAQAPTRRHVDITVLARGRTANVAASTHSILAIVVIVVVVIADKEEELECNHVSTVETDRAHDARGAGTQPAQLIEALLHCPRRPARLERVSRCRSLYASRGL